MNLQPMNESSLPGTGLAAALAEFNPGVDAQFVPRLERYCQLLWEWNQTHNLTRHTDFQAFVTRDLLDSVELSQEIGAGLQILDVGQVGCVPGIPLAILRPDLKVSNGGIVVAKKAAVLTDMVRKLSLHMPVYAERARSGVAEESVRPRDSPSSRAAHETPDLVSAMLEIRRSHPADQGAAVGGGAG